MVVRSASNVENHCFKLLKSDDKVIYPFVFFQNEKVSDTKHRLQQLMAQISSTTDKSLLVQTVVLFETLVNKIQQLTDENQALKSNELDRDHLVLDLESTKNKLEFANQVLLKLCLVLQLNPRFHLNTKIHSAKI